MKIIRKNQVLAGLLAVPIAVKDENGLHAHKTYTVKYVVDVNRDMLDRMVRKAANNKKKRSVMGPLEVTTEILYEEGKVL